MNKKNEKKNRCCNSPMLANNIIIEQEINHSFCKNCGSIYIKTPSGNIHYTIKPKHKKHKTEIEPLKIIRVMKKRTEEHFPFLNEEYNISDKEKSMKDIVFNSINLYLKHRKSLLLVLQKLMRIFDYTDLIFYQCLFFIDIYLSHKIYDEMSEKVMIYYLIGYFLIASKSKETNIYEPDLDSFCCIKKNIYLTIEKIAYYEVVCLKNMSYNIFSYSAYDWIVELSTIGYVFDCEINKNNEIILIKGHSHSLINTIYKYVMKLLLDLTTKDVYIKYSPMYIAFSLIQISREKFLEKDYINKDLYNSLINLYGVNFKDYKYCYKELKKETNEKSYEKNKNIDMQYNEKISKDNNIKENICNNMNINNNFKIEDANIIIPNKMKSSTGLINLKEIYVKSKVTEEKNNSKNNDDNKNIIIKINDNDIKNNGGENNNSNCKNDENSIDDNIIVYDENNEEKNNEVEGAFPKLDLNETNEKPIERQIDKLIRRSNTLTHADSKNNSRISINCDNKLNLFKSNDNLPKINKHFERSSHSLNSKDNNSIDKTNSFLKSNRKPLNPIKFKKTISLNLPDKKKYLLNTDNTMDSENNKDNFINKEKLNSMKKSLFYDTISNKNLMKHNSIDALNINGKTKLANIIPKNAGGEKEQLCLNNFEEKEDKINEKKKLNRDKCKSKEKSINTMAGKEIKFYVGNKRYLSNNKIQKRAFAKNFNLNNVDIDI